MNDARGLSEGEIRRIEKDIINGIYNDHDIGKLFMTILVQRRILRILFNKFYHEPLRLVSTADPVRNSELTYLKELVSMEDGRDLP